MLFYLLTGVTIVGPDELGVVQRFGRRLPSPLWPGLCYRIPWPIEQVTKIKPSRIQVAELGFRTLGKEGSQTETGEPPAYEWNLQHRSGRYERRPDEALMLTGDENLIEVNAVVQYSVVSADKFLFSTTDPNTLIRVAAESALRSLIGQNTLDAALTTGRTEIERDARALLQARPRFHRERQALIPTLGEEIDPLIPKQRLTFNTVAVAFEIGRELLEFHFFEVVRR